MYVTGGEQCYRFISCRESTSILSLWCRNMEKAGDIEWLICGGVTIACFPRALCCPHQCCLSHRSLVSAVLAYPQHTHTHIHICTQEPPPDLSWAMSFIPALGSSSINQTALSNTVIIHYILSIFSTCPFYCCYTQIITGKKICNVPSWTISYTYFL